MKVQLLMPAAGAGARLRSAGPKALVDVAGEPMLVRTLKRFLPLGLVDRTVIVAPPGHRDRFVATLSQAFVSSVFVLVEGGAERQQSVANGLAELSPDTDVVVIHDAARPFVPMESVREVIRAAAEFGAASVAVPTADTIFLADENQCLQETPTRNRMWMCQTPQAFRVDLIRTAHEAARRNGVSSTDDATLVRRIGGMVKLVMGSSLNFKITTPADLELAACLVERQRA